MASHCKRNEFVVKISNAFLGVDKLPMALKEALDSLLLKKG